MCFARQPRLLALPLALLVCSAPASAQIVTLNFFNPPEVGGLCGLGFDTVTDDVWVYECSGASLHRYAADGTFLSSIARPGESANDVDVEIAPEALTLGTTTVPAGTLLFVNGEAGPAEIYALDPSTGAVLATLNTTFGISHVVGGAYHPQRHTFFLVQDNVPGPGDENRIAEIHPATGSVLNTFQITSLFQVNFGDVEVSDETGNLFVVSSDEAEIAEFTPDGNFVQYHAPPSGVNGLSGIGLDCAVREAWVSSTSGAVWRLGDVPCGIGCPLSFNSASIAPLTVAPGGQFTVSINVANSGPGPRPARLDLGYTRSGGGLSGTLALGQGTVPQTSGVPASVTQRVPGNAPAGSYVLDLNLVDVGSGVVCDTRPFTLTVQAARVGAGSPFEATSGTPDLFASAVTADEAEVQVSPNPAQGQATFRFTLDAAAPVRLAVYDALGREVAVLMDGSAPAGLQEVSLETSALPAGVYLYRLVVGGEVEVGQLTVVR
jgi:hypothetical protein